MVKCSRPAQAISDTHDEWFKHVGPLPVQKPSAQGFSISSNLTTHSEKTGVSHATVENVIALAANTGGRSYWPKPLLSNAEVVPDAPPAVVVLSAVAPP